MTLSTTSTDTCRLTVLAGTRRADLAVPAELSVAELLTVVVTGLGPAAAERGVGEGGWVLQRVGGHPLSPAGTLEGGGVVDGDVLHLRTRATELPPVVFDDVPEAVADGVRTRTRRWTPTQTGQAATAFAGTLLALAAVLAVSVGPGWAAPSATLGVGAVLLGMAAVAIGRVARRRGPALTAAGLAVGWAAGSGATALGADHRLADFGAAHVLAGLGAAALAALVLLVALSDGVAGFLTVAVGALLGAVGLGAAVALDLDRAAPAAIVVALGLAVSPVLPTVALRLSRLRLPLVPLDPPPDGAGGADARHDAVDPQQVLDQAVRADRYLTGLVGGVALAVCTAAIVLAGRGGVPAGTLSVTAGAVCLLRARLFTGRGQRTLLLVPGGVAVAAAAVGAALTTHGTVRLLGCAVPIAVLGAVLVGLTDTLAGRRHAPSLVRAADIAETLLVLAAMPLVPAVLGVYTAVRR